MRAILMIAAAEWQYWLRSNALLAGVLLFVGLFMGTSAFTALQIDTESHSRMHHQQAAEAAFRAQPDRHPHRMVHYGHYVFRHPTPLAVFDPGLDSLTGQSIFLEGHRQNSAMFAQSGASANLGGFAWLTPAFIYQFFAPLLIILFGHGAIVREREAKVLGPLLAQGVDGFTIIMGKFLAILSFALLLLIPICGNIFLAFVNGETAVPVLSLLGSYFIYLLIWAGLTLCMSAFMKRRADVLATLSALWLAITLVLPSMMVELAVNRTPLAGKIETDFAMLRDLRKLGDGHNANDPAFKQLRENVLKQYDVERVEELPVNFRGIVAMDGERKLTEVMNRYAGMRMETEARQAQYLSETAWFVPLLAIAEASRAISGTDLSHYHRFLNEAEALRFDFVQGLNQAHVEKLSYQDDINRNKDKASWQRARVDASSWELLDSFVFEPANPAARLSHALGPIKILVVWSMVILGGLFWSARSLKP